MFYDGNVYGFAILMVKRERHVDIAARTCWDKPVGGIASGRRDQQKTSSRHRHQQHQTYDLNDAGVIGQA